MKIAYIASYSLKTSNSWSQSGYQLATALEKCGANLELIGPLRDLRPWYFRSKRLIYKLFRKNYLRDREPAVVQNYALQLERNLAGKKFDILLSPGSKPVASLDCDLPIIIWTDATFAGMVNFYPDFTNLDSRSLYNGNFFEGEALRRCRLAIYTSGWACKTALSSYGVVPEKIREIPFGVNFTHLPGETEIIEILESRERDRCRLLFIGFDWYRKGGDIAMKVAEHLHLTGLPVELSLVGSKPSGKVPVWVKDFGMLSRSRSEDLTILRKCYRQAHFLLMPSRADCLPQVIGEAFAFGVPVIAADVGGISSGVDQAENGALLPSGAAPSDYSRIVYELWSSPTKYRQLALGAYQKYATKLNWDTAGERAMTLFDQVISD